MAAALAEAWRIEVAAWLMSINGPYIATPVIRVPRELPVSRSPTIKSGFESAVEPWRPLVAEYFAAGDVDLALCVISYESGGDPDAANPTSSARGLFQHLGRYWEDRSRRAGWEGADILDPTANVAVAAWLAYYGGWSHWVTIRRCR